MRRLPPTPFNWRATTRTIVGNGSPLIQENAQPLLAGLSDPFGVAVGRDGTIYVADGGGSNRILRLKVDGPLETIAGGKEGFADGVGDQASFNSPSGLVLDNAGNLFVADTGTNAIRKITPEGVVSTVAGTGKPGFADGPSTQAQFNGPIGVGIDEQGNVFVADTYNDRIRKIANGQVTTVAGVGRPGYSDGEAQNALFDTPCDVLALADGGLLVADSGNNQLRKVGPMGQVSTVSVNLNATAEAVQLRKPVGLALTHDGYVYVTESDRGRIVQLAPDGRACVIAGNGSGFADGADSAHFNQPSGIAIDPRVGDLIVADNANYLVRRLSGTTAGTTSERNEPLPKLTTETLGEKNMLWPIDPQNQPHEVVATIGEVRGAYESTDSRDHLHSGLDVFGAYGEIVRAVRSEKITSPLPNWGFDSLSEGLRVGVFSYIHMHVGRDKDERVFDDSRFIAVAGDDGRLDRMRVKRGTRFRVGDALGTINKMYHVHLIVGPSGAEINPLSLAPIGFKDTIAPTIEPDGVEVFDESGNKLSSRDRGRLLVQGRVRIIVDAFDRCDLNSDRRRLGLYSLGYQLLRESTTASTTNAVDKKKSTASTALVPAVGFESPKITIMFDRLPHSEDAPKVAYAADSGITVYGSKTTRFLYEVTNTVRDGMAAQGLFDTTTLPKGDYLLRIVASDFSGNQTLRDLPIAIR